MVVGGGRSTLGHEIIHATYGKRYVGCAVEVPVGVYMNDAKLNVPEVCMECYDRPYGNGHDNARFEVGLACSVRGLLRRPPW